MEKKRILVVDDEEALCKAIKWNLEDADKFIVRTDTRGTAILEIVTEFKPDLIILDLVMPEINGLEVEEILKQSDKSKDIPIIFLTAMVREEGSQGQGAFTDGRYILAKPVTAEQIIESILIRLKSK